MKKYNCPYCSKRFSRDELSSHLDTEHIEMIPDGITAIQLVFNLVNKRDHGICVVCKRATEWQENNGKYGRLCGRTQCADALRDAYKKNMIKVHGKTTLLNDPEIQKRMLANRGISGKYKFTDGGYHVYTGSYEHRALEFIDKVLGFSSSEIMCPGPIFEYEYNGDKHQWITDMLIIPFNLVIEVKDGGNSPNNRTMTSYREKQVAKEKLISEIGTFNYLRLTDNDFSQLLFSIAELKAQMIDDSEDNKKVIININEEVEALQEGINYKMIKDKLIGSKPKNYNIRLESYTKAKEAIYNSADAYGFKKYMRVFPYDQNNNQLTYYVYEESKTCLLFAVDLKSISKEEDRRNIVSKIKKFLNEINIEWQKISKFKDFEIKLHLDTDKYKYGEFAIYHYNKINEGMEFLEEMSVESKLDKDHTQKGNKSLSSFKKVSINYTEIQRYKSNMKSLSHIRTTREYKGTIFLDKDKPVCYVNVNIDTGMVQALEISKDYQGYGLSSQLVSYAMNALHATSLTVNKNNEVAIKVYKQMGFKIIKSSDTMITMSTKKNIQEFMGCAGPGGMPGAGQGIYMTQYGPKSTFGDDNVEGYAIHNDIITDRILLVDKRGNLTVKESSFLQGRKLRIFKYVGENALGYANIISSVNKRAYREYLYEALTGKRLLSDDQVICDDCFTEVSAAKIFSEYSSVAQTIVDQYKKIMGEEVIRLPLMSKAAIKEASKLLGNNRSINVFENMNGYFAENAVTRERTAYFKRICDIQIEVIKC